MPLAPNGFPTELNGKEAIFNQYKGLPDNFTSMSFPRKISATNDRKQSYRSIPGNYSFKGRAANTTTTTSGSLKSKTAKSKNSPNISIPLS
jgi:hypothetical protein